jgi:flagellar operon protein
MKGGGYMLLNDFLKAQNRLPHIDTGQVNVHGTKTLTEPKRTEKGESFAEILAQKSKVEFSGHAMRRIESRSIDIAENSTLDRLNKGVEMAAQKGSRDALVLVDSTAFLVSVANNKVITTMSGVDLAGTVFTNIDSTIII